MVAATRPTNARYSSSTTTVDAGSTDSASCWGAVVGIETLIGVAVPGVEVERQLVALVGSDVDLGEVGRLAAQQGQRGPGDGGGVLGVRQLGTQHVQRPHPAAVDHLAGGLGDDVEDTEGYAGGVADRGVAEGEVALLQEPAAVQRHRGVGDEHGLAGAHHLLHQRADLVPDLGEDVHRPLAQRAGVLVADELDVRLVVEQHALGPPEQRHRELRAEHHVDRGAQRRAPGLRLADRGLAPPDARVRVGDRTDVVEQDAHVAR